MTDFSAFVSELDKKCFGVLGLGASGLSVIKAFAKHDVKIFAWDDNEERQAQASDLGALVQPLEDEVVLAQCDFVVLAPGVPLTHPKPHPVVQRAQALDVEVLGDIELFARTYKDAPWQYLSVTGTNGKSTTTTLIHHILKACGKTVALGGNIGIPVFDMKVPKGTDGIVVLELSSFQLDLCCDFSSDVSVLLNVTPDHIDRHGSMEGYAATKEKMFTNTTSLCVIGVDDAWSKGICERALSTDVEGRKVVPISVEHVQQGGVFVQGGVLVDDTEHVHNEVGSISSITKLHGRHNMQNAACAYAAVRAFGLSASDILEALKSYPGLPHRQFPARVMHGIAYINDSKATNAEATSKALACHKNIYWILGGKQKDGGLNGLEGFMDKVRYAFLIGEASADFADWLDKYGVEHRQCGTMDVAVKDAHRMAHDDLGKPGGAGVVLLSPACASYDQFQSFEERGDVFTDLVMALEDGGAD